MADASGDVDARARVLDAARALARRDDARAALWAARAERDRAGEALVAARADLHVAHHELHRMQAVSLTHVRSRLRGTYRAELEPVQAAHDRAQAREDAARERMTAANHGLSGAETELRNLGDVDGRLRRAVRQRRAGTPSDAPRVAEQVETWEQLQADVAGLVRARDAAEYAARALAAAEPRLDDAARATLYDLIGGEFGDFRKYHELSRAQQAMAAADRALDALSEELTAVSRPDRELPAPATLGTGGLALDAETAAFDVFAESLLVEIRMPGRLQRADERVTALRPRVDGLAEQLREAVRRAVAEEQGVRSRLVDLLTAP